MSNFFKPTKFKLSFLFISIVLLSLFALTGELPTFFVLIYGFAILFGLLFGGTIWGLFGEFLGLILSLFIVYSLACLTEAVIRKIKRK